jgi:outer membrane cobalamin receptor
MMRRIVDKRHDRTPGSMPTIQRIGIVAAASMAMVVTLHIEAAEPADAQRSRDSSAATTSGWASLAQDTGRSLVVIDQTTIRRTGYATLAELSFMAPGLYPVTTAADNSVIVSRGSPAGKGDHQVVMIDGIVVNNSLNRHAPVDRELSLVLADRIEMSSTAAALFHGDKSINGLIAIVTAAPATDGISSHADMGAGFESGTPDDIDNSASEALLHQNLFGSFTISRWGNGDVAARKNGRELQIAFGYYQREASLEYGRLLNESTGAYAPTALSAPFKNNETTYFGRVQGRVTEGVARGLGFGAISLSRETGFGISWTPEVLKPSVSNNFTTLSIIPYLRFDRDLTRRMQLNLAVALNYGSEKGWNENDAGNWAPFDTNGVSAYGLATNHLSADGRLTYAISDAVNLIAGLALSRTKFDSSEVWLHQSNWFFGPNGADSAVTSPDRQITYAAFLAARGVVPLLQGLTLTAGVRSDNTVWHGANTYLVLPSASATLALGRGLGVRAKYATGFVNPSIQELAWNDALTAQAASAGISAQPATLQPEMVHMLEGSVEYADSRVTALVTPYYTIGRNRIEKNFRQDAGTPAFTRNSRGVTHTRGCDTRLTWRVTAGLHATVGADVCHSDGAYGADDFGPDGRITASDTIIDNIVPNAPQVKGYCCLDYTAPFGLTTFLAFKGIRPALYTTRVREPETWLLDLNLTQPIGGIMVIGVKISNLLNHQYYFFRGAVPGPNRTISLSIIRDLR